MNEEMSKYLHEKLEEIIEYLAYENKEFVCTACLHTMEKIYDIARVMLSYETSWELMAIEKEIMEDKDE